MALEITGERVVQEDSFLVMKERSFTDRSGASRKWSYVSRRNDRGAVVIVPTTRESGSLIVIRQFRVPFGGALIEFPAGLIDDGEEPDKAALRELEEETGYRGRIVSVGPAVSTSAGLTTELVHIVYVETDEHPEAERENGPESSEDIEVMRIPRAGCAEALRRWNEAGDILDIKLYLHFQSVIAALRV